MPTTAVPNILVDPGYLFWAPLGSAEPTNTVSGSKFTDAWPVAWLSLGATKDGSEFTPELTVEEILVAEFFDPVAYRTTKRTNKFAFALADITMKNWSRAMNGGGAVVTVSGSGATLLSSFVPTAPGAEIRAMLGWEALGNDLRLIVYQTICAGAVKLAFKKAPDFATIPCEFSCEVPSSGIPWKMYSAGTARVGT